MRDFIRDLLRSWRDLPPPWRVLGALVAGGVVVVAAMGLVIAKLVDDVLGADGLTRLDPRVTQWMVRHRSPGLTSIAKFLTAMGNPVCVAATVLLCAALWTWRHRPRLAAFVIVSSGGAALVTMTAKFVVGRPRPPRALRLVEATGAAFPSGHATQSVACWAACGAALIIVVRRPLLRAAIAVVAVLLAAGIGASRVYLGVHWASDVVCGWAVASLWLVVLLLAGWAGPRLVSASRSAIAPPPLGPGPNP